MGGSIWPDLFANGSADVLKVCDCSGVSVVVVLFIVTLRGGAPFRFNQVRWVCLDLGYGSAKMCCFFLFFL